MLYSWLRASKLQYALRLQFPQLKTQYAAAHCIEEQRADQKNCASQEQNTWACFLSYPRLFPVKRWMEYSNLECTYTSCKCTSEILTIYGNIYTSFILPPWPLCHLRWWGSALGWSVVSFQGQSQGSWKTNQQFRMNSVAQLIMYIFPVVYLQRLPSL